MEQQIHEQVAKETIINWLERCIRKHKRTREHQKVNARASLIDIDTDYLNGTHV